jgi:hypothetical protein
VLTRRTSDWLGCNRKTRLSELNWRLQIRPKRKKAPLVPNPNTQFASIEQIHRAQSEASRVEDPLAEESWSESRDSEDSYIEVG